MAQQTASLPISNWTYWLSGPDPAAIARSGFDLAVVDYSRDGSERYALKRLDLMHLQTMPDGGRRIVLAYMSIGEAETYRAYWRPEWQKSPPGWLEAENPDWAGNIKVRFWEPDWQRLILGRPDAYLDRILAAGFDGVYLDIVDAYWYWQEKGRRSAADEMVSFVARIAGYARSRRPGFLVVPQNAEDLLARDDYLAVVDGIAKESLLYGQPGPERPNPPDEVAWSRRLLERARNAGKLVLAVEYVQQPALVAEAYRRLRALDFLPYATVRELDRMTLNAGLDPPPVRPLGGGDTPTSLGAAAPGPDGAADDDAFQFRSDTGPSRPRGPLRRKPLSGKPPGRR